MLKVGYHTFVPLAQHWNGLRVSALMPYTWFIRVPGLSIFREADRMTLLALVGAALLAGAGVDWLVRQARQAGGGTARRAWPAAALVVVAVLGIAEAGWPGSPRGVPAMPATRAALDGPIAADHSGSVVVDVAVAAVA